MERIHPQRFNGFLIVYGGVWNAVKRWSFVVSFCFFVFSLGMQLVLSKKGKLSGQKIYHLIESMLDLSISSISALLGLSLAGLALIVSFIEGSTAKRMVRNQVLLHDKELSNGNEIPSSKMYSSYQKIISKFTWSVFIQAVVFCLLWFAKGVQIVEIPFPTKSGFVYFNAIVLSIISSGVLYAVLLIIQMTLNIFNLSQINHATLYSETVKEIQKN
ncbi:MAG: hypothetical protein AAGC47_07140 [Bacteroidota bacterium]